MVVELRQIALYPDSGKLCKLPYPGHPKGCPCYGSKAECPPKCVQFVDKIDTSKPVYAIINEFDLANHMRRMKLRHPQWSDRQLRCCLYWQTGARKKLAAKVTAFLVEHEDYAADFCPEAEGVNVTQTLRLSGINLEWPPRKIARQVAFVGVLKEKRCLV
jgi:hypothetical protein